MATEVGRHTAGPWEARDDRTVAAGGVPLLRFYAGRNEKANARLVSAAPELMGVFVKVANALADYVSSDADSLTLELASSLLAEMDSITARVYGYDQPEW